MERFEAAAATACVGMVVEQAGGSRRPVQPLGTAHVPYSSREITFHWCLRARHQDPGQTGILDATLYDSVRGFD